MIKDRILGIPNPKILMLGILLAVVMIFAKTSRSPVEIKIQSTKGEITEGQEKLRLTNEKTRDKAKFQEELGQVSQTVRLALEYLPKELDQQDLLKKIYSEARNAGVQLSHYQPKESVSKDFYDEVPIEISLKGNYSQIVLFLSYVSKLPRIINIKNVEIADPVVTDGVPVMKLTGILLAYRYKEGK